MLISVVIPLYNKAHTIVNTLNTVMRQTYRDYEVIIVNDGSTDDGVAVIEKNFNDSRIRIVNQKNAGVSVARNRGVDEAKGEWIAFLDADDEWLPTYLEALLEVLKEHPKADMIGCASYYKDLITGKISANAIIDKYYEKTVCINYFINPDKMTHVGATILSKNVFQQIGGFNLNLRSNEDLLLLGTIAMNGYFVYVGKCLHVYVGNVSGQATSDTTHQDILIKNKIEVLNKFYDLYLNSKRKNKLVPISIKYRGRGLLLQLLKKRQYTLLNVAVSQLYPDVRKLLCPAHIFLKPAFNKLGITYIYITKLIWRIHGFPRVGTLSKYNSELIRKYLQVYG